MNDVIGYSVKVWFTTLILSPTLWIVSQAFASPMSFLASASFIFLSAFFAFIITIPSWLLLWFSMANINKMKNTIYIKKGMVSIVGLLLVTLNFYFFFHKDRNLSRAEIYELAMCYCTAIGFATWLFKLRTVVSQSLTD